MGKMSKSISYLMRAKNKDVLRLVGGPLVFVIITGFVTPAFAILEGLDDGDPPVGDPKLPSVSPVQVLIDFEACPIGTMPSYTEDGAVVTGVGDVLSCRILPGTCTGTCAIGGTSPFFPVRTDFPTLVSAVSAEMGDQSSDLDVMTMEAFDTSDVLVDSATLDCGNCIGAFTLSVSGPNIAYIITSSVSTIGGSSVLVDNILFTPQVSIGGTLLPIDTTALLLAGVQSISMWMIPVVVAGIVIGVFVIKRRK